MVPSASTSLCDFLRSFFLWTRSFIQHPLNPLNPHLQQPPMQRIAPRDQQRWRDLLHGRYGHIPESPDPETHQKHQDPKTMEGWIGWGPDWKNPGKSDMSRNGEKWLVKLVSYYMLVLLACGCFVQYLIDLTRMAFPNPFNVRDE